MTGAENVFRAPVVFFVLLVVALVVVAYFLFAVSEGASRRADKEMKEADYQAAKLRKQAREFKRERSRIEA